MLRNAYHKPKSVIFARHLPISCTQKSSESHKEYVHALKQLARECEFRAVTVTADKHRNELARDAFINGINLVSIRPEEVELAFQNAINKVARLGRAQEQSAFYESKSRLQSVTITNDPESKNHGRVSMRVTT